MKVIELLNKIAHGEIEEDTMFEYSHGNGYKEYCTTRQFFNRYIVDKENLNLEIYEDKEEDKKIEELENYISCGWNGTCKDLKREDLFNDLEKIGNKINEIIDHINKEDKNENND